MLKFAYVGGWRSIPMIFAYFSTIRNTLESLLSHSSRVQYPDSSRKGINYLFDLVRIYHQSYLEWKVLNDDRCNCKTGAHVFSPFKFSEKFMFFVWFAAANKLMSITIILNASFRDHWLWGMYWIDWFYTRINWISEKLNTRRVGQQWF